MAKYSLLLLYRQTEWEWLPRLQNHHWLRRYCRTPMRPPGRSRPGAFHLHVHFEGAPIRSVLAFVSILIVDRSQGILEHTAAPDRLASNPEYFRIQHTTLSSRFTCLTISASTDRIGMDYESLGRPLMAAEPLIPVPPSEMGVFLFLRVEAIKF